MFQRVFHVRTSPWIDFTTHIYSRSWNMINATYRYTWIPEGFWEFEIKKWTGGVTNHNHDHFPFWIFSWLIGPQQGLSIYPLWIEKSSYIIDHLILHILLVFQPLRVHDFTHEIMKIWKIKFGFHVLIWCRWIYRYQKHSFLYSSSS